MPFLTQRQTSEYSCYLHIDSLLLDASLCSLNVANIQIERGEMPQPTVAAVHSAGLFTLDSVWAISAERVRYATGGGQSTPIMR
ncbi:MAG: hypothetical protein ACREQ4_16270 [Candidatus Binataceae bacterium]